MVVHAEPAPIQGAERRWTTLIFWTSDAVATMNSAYYQNGQLVWERARILRKYLKTWFIIDALTIGIEWTVRPAAFVPNR